MTSERIAALCRNFARKRILVVGDVMLDHYIDGTARRVSPEAPVLVVDFAQEHYLPGGAANVAHNLASLGARVELAGVVGADAHAGVLRSAVREAGITKASFVAERGRATTLKTRVRASHQQMIRIDRENRQPLAAGTRRRLLQGLERSGEGAAAIIVADYAKGVIDQETIDRILAFGRRANVPVCIDPKPVRRLQMKGCELLTPNRRETFELAGMADEPVGERPLEHRALREAMRRIQGTFSPRILLVTLGEGGMLVRERGQAPRHLPTAAREVYDVSGAGDTVIATFVIARAAGADVIEAATLANLAAGIVVGKRGTASVKASELVAVGTVGNKG